MPELQLHNYRAVIKRWVDADTVILDIDQGFRDWKHDQRIRVIGIDAPDKQPAKGTSRLRAANLFPPGTKVVVRTKLDKAGEEENSFERWLGHVLLPNGASYADLAIGEGMAVPWDGEGPHPVQPS